jgi:hypothetical protein
MNVNDGMYLKIPNPSTSPALHEIFGASTVEPSVADSDSVLEIPADSVEAETETKEAPTQIDLLPRVSLEVHCGSTFLKHVTPLWTGLTPDSGNPNEICSYTSELLCSLIQTCKISSVGWERSCRKRCMYPHPLQRQLRSRALNFGHTMYQGKLQRTCQTVSFYEYIR